MPTESNRFFIVLFGPTAVGKTALSLALAQQHEIEIINMDVGQLYTPLSIGTAKPAWRSEPTPHHLFDCIDDPRDYTVVEYRTQALGIMERIWSRNKLPVLVGGSGFYLSSLFFPPRPTSTQGATCATAKKQAQGATLWETLNAIDPIRAAALHPNDTYRIQRALDIWYTTNQKPSDYTTLYQPPASCLLVFLTRHRTELYTRINKRVEVMFEEGFEQEVAKLRGTPWEPFLHKKKLIGYPDLFEYLAGGKTPMERVATIHSIQQKTRAYAKRQETFWRMLEKKLSAAQIHTPDGMPRVTMHTINLTIPVSDQYISDLLKHAVPFCHGCTK